MTYTCGPLDNQKQDNQLEPSYNSSVPIQDVGSKTYRKRGTIEKGSGRGSGRSVLAVWHDDDDDDDDGDLHIVFKSKIIWTRICQVIRSRNVIDFSKTPNKKNNILLK